MGKDVDNEKDTTTEIDVQKELSKIKKQLSKLESKALNETSPLETVRLQEEIEKQRQELLELKKSFQTEPEQDKGNTPKSDSESEPKKERNKVWEFFWKP